MDTQEVKHGLLSLRATVYEGERKDSTGKLDSSQFCCLTFSWKLVLYHVDGEEFEGL